jgi:hypothetical protein
MYISVKYELGFLYVSGVGFWIFVLWPWP